MADEWIKVSSKDVYATLRDVLAFDLKQRGANQGWDARLEPSRNQWLSTA